VLCTDADPPDVIEAVATLALGTVVSITIALLAPNELAAPGDAKVRVALLLAASLIVPPFSANDVVAT